MVDSKRTEHEVYMRSAKWKRKRKAVLKRCNGICESRRCKRFAKEVHHLTYRNFGDEAMEDLRAVCGPCHTQHHPERSMVFDKYREKKYYQLEEARGPAIALALTDPLSDSAIRRIQRRHGSN